MVKSSKLLALEKMHTQKISFAGFPTPLQRMPNLSRVLGGPSLFVKRDDMTDLAFGGNKARKLEFLFADAKDQGVEDKCGGEDHTSLKAAAGTKVAVELHVQGK